ncbi:MAG TPA: YihY/virulence factor BrkB family protein [Methylomirabilota bacterium]|nr:YihY/virulence factor BrkB family protein [Methylomirabilota bacterium]
MKDPDNCTLEEARSKRVVVGRLRRAARRVWAVVGLAVRKFFGQDGTQWAAAFAFNAFFSLFPLIVLLVTIASFFVDEERAGDEVIAFLQSRTPISGDMERQITETIGGVVEAREQAGVVALVVLVWASLKSFITLIRATNHAWGLARYSWWRLPLRSLLLLGSTAAAVLLGVAAPMLARAAKSWLAAARGLDGWIYESIGFLFPLVVLFLGLSLFYRLAPRRPTRFAEVWAGALCATLLLRAAEALFVIYLKDYATLNALYGAFGGIMALLLWIYISGCIFIFGACLCASRSEVLGQPAGSGFANAG